MTFKAFISAILLSAFGLTLSVDILGHSAHAVACAVDVSSKRQSSQSEISVHKCNSDQQSEEACPDACHLGQSHFGHSSFTCSQESFSYSPIDSVAISHFIFTNSIQNPFLAALRRPPRIS